MILVVALLIFGPKRLPEIGRSLGKGMREFKDSITGSDDEGKARAADLAPRDDPRRLPPRKRREQCSRAAFATARKRRWSSTSASCARG